MLHYPLVMLTRPSFKSLGQYGASKVLNVNDAQLAKLSNAPYARVIAEAAEKEAAQVIVFAHNNAGKAIAPRVSVKLKAGLVAGVTEAPSSYDPFTVKKKAFTGKAFANVVVKSDKKNCNPCTKLIWLG